MILQAAGYGCAPYWSIVHLWIQHVCDSRWSESWVYVEEEVEFNFILCCDRIGGNKGVFEFPFTIIEQPGRIMYKNITRRVEEGKYHWSNTIWPCR